jgi:hypothetical protein
MCRLKPVLKQRPDNYATISNIAVRKEIVRIGILSKSWIRDDPKGALESVKYRVNYQ